MLRAPAPGQCSFASLSVGFSHSCPTNDSATYLCIPTTGYSPCLTATRSIGVWLPFYSCGRRGCWCLTFEPWDLEEEMECQPQEKASLCGIQSSWSQGTPPSGWWGGGVIQCIMITAEWPTLQGQMGIFIVYVDFIETIWNLFVCWQLLFSFGLFNMLDPI